MAEPQVRYTQTEDGVSIAFADMGEGTPLVAVPPPGLGHVQRGWAMLTDFLPPLAQTFRLIWYDARGTGLSDRDAIDFSMDAMMRDLEAVIERTGIESFAVLALSDAVPLAVTYAATYPDRVSHLILIDGWTKASDLNGTPGFEAHQALVGQDWLLYTETVARVLLGLDDPRLIDLFGEYMRACVEPEAYRAFSAALSSYDVSALLPGVRAETLVLHNNDSFYPVQAGQRLAAGIPEARFLAIDDKGYQRVAPLVAEFTGMAAKPRAVEPGAFRTILFTDMESSTALTQRLGDAGAQQVRRAHNEIVRFALTANRGSEVKHTGDGIMASFSTASSALEAAIAIQRGVVAHRQERTDSPLAVYVGLNAGEPIAEDADLFGTSVNLAARICDHAEAGQIVASDVVRQLAAGKDFLFSDLGETELRGFEDPVKLWELRWQD